MLAKWKVLMVTAAVLALGLGSAQAQTLDEGAPDASAQTGDTGSGDAGTEPVAEEPAAEEPAPLVEPVELKVGPANTAGIVSFVLGVSASGDSLAVEAVVSDPMDASAKGALVAETLSVDADLVSSYRLDIKGGAAADRIIDGGLNDTISTGGGADTINLTSGNNVVDAGADNDTVTLGIGADHRNGDTPPPAAAQSCAAR